MREHRGQLDSAFEGDDCSDSSYDVRAAKIEPIIYQNACLDEYIDFRNDAKSESRPISRKQPKIVADFFCFYYNVFFLPLFFFLLELQNGP